MRVFLVLDDGRGLEQRRAGADAGDTLTDNDSLGSRMIRGGSLKEFRDSLIFAFSSYF